MNELMCGIMGVQYINKKKRGGGWGAGVDKPKNKIKIRTLHVQTLLDK